MRRATWIVLMMKKKEAVTREIVKRYQKRSKKQKGLIPDEFVAIIIVITVAIEVMF